MSLMISLKYIIGLGRNKTLFLASFLLSAMPQAFADTIRILPLGDSITQGGRKDRPEYSYRYDLYCSLRESGYVVDFIGSLASGLDAEAEQQECGNVPFDRDHEGHYGWKTAEVRDHLADWLKTYPAPPDIVLVHLGTNDRDAASYQEAIISPLTDIVGMLRQRNPRVTVLIGHLNETSLKNLVIRAWVSFMAWRLDNGESRILTVPHYQDFHSDPNDPQSDTFDWIHPNRSGQAKMAANWLHAMLPLLAGARPARP